MKKRIFKNGFTIAELLITMLVVLVVTAAVVPFIGPKKIKHPRILSNHGVFECYWETGEDGSQVLKQYMRAGKNSGVESDQDAVTVPNGQYCTFNVPKANFFKVEMVGAGGDGFGSDLNTANAFAQKGIGYGITEYKDNRGNYDIFEGVIPTNLDGQSKSAFYDYMGYNAQNRGDIDTLGIGNLRNFYNNSGVGPFPAAYLAKLGRTEHTEITPSGPGPGGTDYGDLQGLLMQPVYAGMTVTTQDNGRYSIFMVWLKNNETGQNNGFHYSEDSAHSGSPDKYQFYANQGVYEFKKLSDNAINDEFVITGHWTNLLHKLSPNNNLVDKINSNSTPPFCKAGESQSQINMVLQAMYDKKESGTPLFCQSRPDSIPTRYGIEPIKMSENSNGEDTNASDSGFAYKIYLPALSYKYGGKGGAAKIFTKTYPKFSVDQLRIYPANRRIDTESKTKIVAITQEGPKTLRELENGVTKTEVDTRDDISLYKREDEKIKFLHSDVKNNIQGGLPSGVIGYITSDAGPSMGVVFNNIHGKNPLKDAINERKTKSPGRGGNGSYKMVKNVSGGTKIELYDSFGDNHGTTESNPNRKIQWSGPVNDSTNCKNGFVTIGDYCKGSEGNPGAVVITW